MKNYSTPFLEKLIPILGILFAVAVLAIVKPEILLAVTILGIDVSQLVGLVVGCYLLVITGNYTGNVLYGAIAFLLTMVGLIKPMTCCEKVIGNPQHRIHHIFGEAYLMQCPTCKRVWSGK